MSVIPKIKCPPDYSIRCFRLVDSMSFGIVKGAETEISIPTKGICIPVSRYDDRRLVLRAGKTQKLDIEGIAEYGPLKETYEFEVDLTANSSILDPGTHHKYELYDENLNLIESMSFTVVDTFFDSLTTAFNASSMIKNLVMFNAGLEEGRFSVESAITETKYRHLFYFDLDGFGGYLNFPYIHPGNLKQKYRKYEEGGVKIILIIPEFAKVNVDTCGCADSSGAILSNKKYFQYSFASDYERNESTPILAQGNPYELFYEWSQQSKDHIGYHFEQGSLVSMNSVITKRSFIEKIQGFSLKTDAPMGDDTTSFLSHVWSPRQTTWHNSVS